jgi:hypothetical protein
MQFNFNLIFKFATHGSTNFYGIDTCSTMSIFVHVFSFHYSNEIVSRAFLLHSFNNSTKYETDVSAINRLYFYLLLVFKTCLTRLRVITLVARTFEWWLCPNKNALDRSNKIESIRYCFVDRTSVKKHFKTCDTWIFKFLWYWYMFEYVNSCTCFQ